MSVQEIDEKLTDLRKQLDTVQGTKCECYQRVVGYYRNVNNWNAGKREEYNYRKPFDPASTPTS